MRSKALLISLSGITCVIIGSIWILPCIYQSTIFGTSVRPRAPPNAVPFQTRPVTSWNGRVEISAAAAAPPIPIDCSQPRGTAAVTGFQRLAHDRDIAGAVEGVVGSPDLVGSSLGHVDEVGDEVLAE